MCGVRGAPAGSATEITHLMSKSLSVSGLTWFVRRNKQRKKSLRRRGSTIMQQQKKAAPLKGEAALAVVKEIDVAEKKRTPVRSNTR